MGVSNVGLVRGARRDVPSGWCATQGTRMLGEIETGQDSSPGDGRWKEVDVGRMGADLETYHSVDASVLCENLVEATDGGQEDDVAVVEEWNPGGC
jgi:hypothetical protein